MGIETWEEVVSVVSCDQCDDDAGQACAEVAEGAERLARELASEAGFVHMCDTTDSWLCPNCAKKGATGGVAQKS